MLLMPSAPQRLTTHGFRLQSISGPSTASSRSASRISNLSSLKTIATTASSRCKSTQSLARSHALPVKVITRSISTESATVDSPSTPASPLSTPLAWNEYFSLRRSRRNYNLIASIGACACTTTGGAVLIDNYSDLIGTWITLDPVPMGIIGIVASAAVGWLSGPMFGSAVFRMLHRRVSGEMIEKEKDFFTRIKKYRVDPSGQSMSNPVPDFYGEKIGSVADFRTWMKDQRAFNKKRQTF